MVAPCERAQLVGRLYQIFPQIPDQNAFYNRAELEVKQALAGKPAEVGVEQQATLPETSSQAAETLSAFAVVQIPVFIGLSPESLQSGSLVQYTGMVSAVHSLSFLSR